MKILQIITSLNTGGAEKLLIESVPHYQQKGIDVDVVTLTKNKSPFRHQLQKVTKGRVIGLTSSSVYNPMLIFKIIPYLKLYDIVHVHLFPALYWVVLAKWISFSKTKIVYTEHSTHNKRRESKIFQMVDKFMYNKLSFIGCISEATKTNLIKHLNCKKQNIEVVLNGIDLSKFIINPNKEIFNFFDKGNFILIQVSSFREQKDQPTLIKALVSLPENIKLLLVGDGHLKQKNEQEAKNLGIENRVLFLGIRNDIPELLNYADVCILSSHYEGFGLAVLEGMASKKPSIATDVSGVREIVKNYGLLFKQGDSEALANHILKLHKDKEYYDVIAGKCLERSKEFDINKMVQQYIEIYKKVLNK